ncbi:bactericidal permeability-increasing protein-like isoform 2-T4 [Clarias gariepinus]
MVSLWCVLALFTFLFLETLGTNPGIKLRITQNALEYQRQINIKPLVEKLKAIHIPNRSGNGHLLFMDIYFAVRNMHIQNVNVPFSSVRLVPGTGVSLSISDVYIRVTGNWEISYLFVDNGGWFEVDIRGLTISITAGIHQDGTGRPMVSTISCGASVGPVHVTLHGGSSWFYKMFVGFIESNLRNDLQSQICPQVTQALNNMNSHLHTLSVLAQVDEYAEIELSMVELPLVSSSAIDLGLKGKIYNIGNHMEPPFSPTPFSLPHQDSKMLYMALSAFTLNSASFVYNRAGVLSQYVTDNMIPSGSPFRLDTKTFGTLIPQIAKQYPGLKMKLLVKPVKEPHFSFEPNNVTMQASSTVTAYAV